MACAAPFKLTKVDNSCCDTCVASDEDVPLDRHEALGGKFVLFFLF